VPTLESKAVTPNFLRDMQNADLDQVLAIERHSQVTPWSRLSFEESLTKQHLCRVLTHQDQIIAFHIVCPVVDEMHILNIVVSPQAKGQGNGHVLMHDIVDLCHAHNLKKIFLEVRASNVAARGFYQQWQFRQIGQRKGYYRALHGTREDALVLVKENF